MRPTILAFDLEGVLVPEVWIAVAEKTGIDGLRLTTRDVADYDELMRHRLRLLDTHGLRLPDIQDVIATMAPLPRACDYVDSLRERPGVELVILSDTYYEFAAPLMRKLGWPTLFCNSLVVSDDGRISDYRLRQTDGKRKAVQAFHSLAFQVVAAGDSYNDTAMLGEADAGILFRPSETVRAEFPQFPVALDYSELDECILESLSRLDAADGRG